MPKKIGQIIFLTIDFPPMSGGMARHSLDIARAIKGAGEEVTVITSGVSVSEKYEDKTGLRVIRLKGVRAGRCFDHYFRSLLIFFIYGFIYCLSHPVRAVFVNTWSLIGPAALVLSKIFSIPYFVFAHGLDVYAPLKDKKAMWLMKLVLRNSSLVLAISRYTRDLLGREIKGLNSMVLNPVVDLSRFEFFFGRINSVSENKKVILTVGRLVESKNHESVIRAMPNVIKAIPEAMYHIVGDGPAEQSLRQIVADLGLKDKVVFEGNIADEELPGYYYSCDIFVLVSREIPERGEVEGFGIVFLEAAACSKAVIAGKSGGISDAVLDGVTGILVDPLDVEAISSGIIKLLSDDEFRKRLGENSRKRVEETLSTDKLSESIKGILDAE
ncbi:MAG: glycosyltransferase family 4 protein [Candidatus Omnitrophota bacterium]|nr:glycosyltransferase family 4 protein [Candidatus Omnitrophota bacterium]MBU1928483.1 glycosyltransferase family 4 protein [Candidatus Omnitrophota bacterium]MBU2035444.1 glycosyltransferase family 4 protein [Candidatus Omnitrophota bacterium]